ncbi:MAG: hypothetical protein KDA85_16770 [Planctomycetaceae bacterium]|nr:hypothetical protein [Planctomycetaceae bacterium]
MVSRSTTAALRQGDANAIFFRTLREVHERLNFAQNTSEGFPILLVLSEINWRPLDDFHRVRPDGDQLVFEGNFHQQQHFPGAQSGGARATYLSDQGMGWGLVSGDGWRVPYRGTDCVVYHEGCGHTVGLPHPEPGDGSVMSQGQYRGWLSESWLDQEQKVRLGWQPEDQPLSLQLRLFSEFTAIPDPPIPRPGQPVKLKLTWPDASQLQVDSIQLRYQTAIDGPWTNVPIELQNHAAPNHLLLPAFDRKTPVSYRVDVRLQSGETEELWGYFQVRPDDGTDWKLSCLPADLITAKTQESVPQNTRVVSAADVDLLDTLNPAQSWSAGVWTLADGRLDSPGGYGRRLELPVQPQGEYRLTAIVEPLDEPNGLLFGQQLKGHRFATLFNYTTNDTHMSAIENIDGANVGNESTFTGPLFRKNRLSAVVIEVRNSRVTMMVDGHQIVDWQGQPEQLSLSDYWKTPDTSALFLGTYDCRYRFHRLTWTPLNQGDATQTTPGR